MAPLRQPPAFVPTLTDIVAPGEPPAPPAGPATPPPAAGGVDEALVDALTDRVMLRLQPLLRERLQAALADWLARRLAEEAAALVPPLLNDVAELVRAEVQAGLAASRDSAV